MQCILTEDSESVSDFITYFRIVYTFFIPFSLFSLIEKTDMLIHFLKINPAVSVQYPDRQHCIKSIDSRIILRLEVFERISATKSGAP